MEIQFLTHHIVRSALSNANLSQYTICEIETVVRNLQNVHTYRILVSTRVLLKLLSCTLSLKK